MNDIGVGAVGAATIAGLVSLLGLIIGKEQKISEFRQAWIDDLRKCLIAYLVNINAISDALRLKKAGSQFDNQALLENYKLLNEASHGITLRVNAEEKPAKTLLKSMLEFEVIANVNSDLTPDKIRAIEEHFVQASKDLLKFEWKRVKRGENTFVWTKAIVAAAMISMICLLAYLWTTRDTQKVHSDIKSQPVRVAQPLSTKPKLKRPGFSGGSYL